MQANSRDQALRGAAERLVRILCGTLRLGEPFDPESPSRRAAGMADPALDDR